MDKLKHKKIGQLKLFGFFIPLLFSLFFCCVQAFADSKYPKYKFRELISPLQEWFVSLEKPKLKIVEVKTSIVPLPFSAESVPKRYVFSIGLPGIEKNDLVRQQSKEYKQLRKKSIKIASKIARLRFRSRFKKMPLLESRIDGLMDEYLSILDAQKKLWEIGLYQEGKRVNRKIRRKLGHLKNEWTFVPGASVEVILDKIKQADTSDVIIIAHGNSIGTLFDAHANPYHHTFFEWINPNLNTLSIFSCEVEKALSKYFSTQTFYHTKESFKVIIPEFSRESGLTYGRTFNSFLTNVDQFVSKQDPREMAGPMATECSLELNGMIVERGEYQVVLNRKLLGFLSPGSRQQFKFLCHDFIKDRKDHTVLLTPLSERSRAQLEGQQHHVLELGNKRQMKAKNHNIFFADGTYRKSKLVFSD